MKKIIFVLLITHLVSCPCNGQDLMLVCDTTSTVCIICRDADYNKKADNGNIMNLEVFRGNDKIQKISYKYENTGMFTLKQFYLLDLNFDGYADILICAGHTANRGQPFYDGYIWSETEQKFVREPQINEDMPNLLVDTEKKQVYSYYIVNSNEILYSIYRYQQRHYTLVGGLNKLNTLGEHPKYKEVQYNNDKAKESRYIKHENLSDEWKNALAFIANHSTEMYEPHKIDRLHANSCIMDCIDSLYIKHDTAKVRVAIYFVNDRVKELYDKEFEDVSGFCILEHNMSVFCQDSERWLSFNRMLTKYDVGLIARWCLMNEKINSIPLSKDEVSGVLFEEIIFEMKNGAKFFQPFIKNDNQYFGSLAPEQICNLYYDVLRYLTFSDYKSEEEFFSDYFKTFKKILSNQ